MLNITSNSLKPFIIIIINNIIEETKDKVLNIIEIISGKLENATIPSIAYINSLKKLHLVSPATLSIFSYSNHFVLKPTKLNIPL